MASFSGGYNYLLANLGTGHPIMMAYF